MDRQKKIVFEKGERISRKGGFVMPQLIQSSDSGKQIKMSI